VSHLVNRVSRVSSDNVTSGDNQQETDSSIEKLDAEWVVGFVDGEGCFSVSIHKSPFMRSACGWQLLPTFQVYQHKEHRDVLESFIEFFGCGTVRSKGPNSDVLTFAVHGVRALRERVVPFFEEHPLRVKGADFVCFASVVRGLASKEHLQPEGLERLVRLSYAMNAQGKQRSRSLETVLKGSSETAREARPMVAEKIQSDLHGDMQS